MESKPSWIQAWLASLDPILGIYADKFDDFGYNSENILSQAAKEDLEADLAEMSIKKPHGRMIVKHHAKLQEAAAETPSPLRAQISSQGTWEAILQELIPCLTDVVDFQHLGMKLSCPSGKFTSKSQCADYLRKDLPLAQELGTRRKVFIPIMCLRWAQGKIHGQMVFTSGDFKDRQDLSMHPDRSIFELLVDLATGRQSVADIEPLEVVVEDGTLDVVGGSRRATVLRMLQGIWGHATVRAPCHLFAPTDPKVASRFRAKDTQTNGTGILFHGRQQEAWHMGKPLFRCAQEWCDCLNEPVPQDSSSIEADAGTVPNRSLDACGPVNCEAGHLDMPLKKAGTTYSAGNEQNDSCQDTLPAIPKFMQPQVEAEFSTSIRKTERVESFELEAQPSAQSKDSQEGSAAVHGMDTVVCCMWLQGKCWKQGNHRHGRKLFLHEDVPGMACGFGDQCLYQHYKYRVVPNADTAEGSSTAQVPHGQSCVETGHETLDPRVLQVGMVVFMASLWSEFGEVIEISHDSIKAAAPIKVCDVWSRKTAWFSIDSLQVPDYSSLSPGLRVTVICEDKNFLCEILQISDEVSRARAPVHVSYNGYTKADAEWVGADRLRSKALKYVHPRFPSEFQVDAGPKAHSRASDHGGAAVATREETFVCCLWLEGKCWHECEHWLGKKLFLHEDVPGLACGFGDKCTYLHHKNRRIPARDTTEGLVWKPLLCDESCADASAESLHHLVLQVGMLVFFHSGPKPECGKVIEISHDSNEAAAPIKVCGVWSQKTAWFAIDRLQVPDYYSSLELGMRVNVVCKDRSYVCKIIEISYEVSRASAPVRVSYHGSTSAEDEWVGADRLRAKALKYVQPRFPSRLQLETQPAMQISSAENCGLPLPGKNLQSSDTSLAAFEFPASARPEQFVHTESTNQVHSGGEAVIAPAFRSCDSLPWHAEIDEDAIILDRAIEAVAMALKEEGQGGPRQRLLEQALGPLAASSLVGCVLAQHGWTGSHFSLAPELQKLYDHLVKTRSDLFEGGSSCAGVDYDSDAELPAEASEVFLEVENDAASSCAMQADSLDEIIDRQQNTINKLTGTLICGTFRCVAASSEGKLKHCGEVIVERGPAPLLGCKVRIPAGKSRGNAWDCDRCYVRILVAAVSVL
ncbi:unnamed protein product [Symbiodinium pilosum]|uniref:C3H1-type domain-containing protein n=1 Tax=Symbiodinium pilosum TaxID=2952 RepID=A0A812QI72_SYMPI|nr:unnamed protein product [Symbiodinium pilosum]